MVRGKQPRLHQAAPIRVPQRPFMVHSIDGSKGLNPCKSVSIRGCHHASHIGARHEPRRLEQKNGEFGKAYCHFLIRTIGDIRG